MPILGWKNYWYGKYKIIEYINNINPNSEEIIVNFRFDILNNSNNFTEKTIIDFISNNIEKKIIKNVFIYEKETNGIDNIYIGNINKMYKLTHMFYYFLDDIIIKNTDTVNQEKLVFRINKNLFD